MLYFRLCDSFDCPRKIAATRRLPLYQQLAIHMCSVNCSFWNLWSSTVVQCSTSKHCYNFGENWTNFEISHFELFLKGKNFNLCKERTFLVKNWNLPSLAKFEIRNFNFDRLFVAKISIRAKFRTFTLAEIWFRPIFKRS